MLPTKGYAASSPKNPLAPFTFERRTPNPTDIHLEILYCGICHSDIHFVRNEWNKTRYPIVPGHEILGRVKHVGAAVKAFCPGDLAMVGCMVDSCRKCHDCQQGLEQYCQEGRILTYNDPDPHRPGDVTYGGYSNQLVVDEKYALHVPKNFKKEDLPRLAPLVCAGITTYSPLRHWGIKKGMRVGVAGLGGLGHMAIKLAHAMGAEVVLFTTSAAKCQDGKRLGAHHVVLSSHPDQMEKWKGRLDFILNTIAAPIPLDPYLELLKRDGTMCVVGIPELPHPPLSVGNLIFFRRSLAGSLIGGIQETQEMLNFCAEHGITADIELIPIQQVNEAYERTVRGEVKYRFVIDMSSLK